MTSTERLRRFHIERARLARAGEWNAEAERRLRVELGLHERPRARLSEMVRRP